jgi:recombination protein RecR
MEYPSKYLEEVSRQLTKLPGIGQRTAMRLAMHMLKWSEDEIERFGMAFLNLKGNISYCKSCGNISDTETCKICLSHSRDKSIICIVEDFRDVIAIENTQQFKGNYHVLGGIISPMDGIGPQSLNVASLLTKLATNTIKEIIFALPTTMEGDTTSFYLFKKIKNHEVVISTLARGVALGDDLEYIDELTLGKSLLNRTLFEGSISNS